MPPTSPAISDACQRHSALEVELRRETGCHPCCGFCNGFEARCPANVWCPYVSLLVHANQHGEESKSCLSSRTTEEFFG